MKKWLSICVLCLICGCGNEADTADEASPARPPSRDSAQSVSQPAMVDSIRPAVDSGIVRPQQQQPQQPGEQPAQPDPKGIPKREKLKPRPKPVIIDFNK